MKLSWQVPIVMVLTAVLGIVLSLEWWGVIVLGVGAGALVLLIDAVRKQISKRRHPVSHQVSPRGKSD